MQHDDSYPGAEKPARPTGSRATCPHHSKDGPPLPGTASIRGFRAAVTAEVRYSCRAYMILNALQDVLKVLADLLG